MTKLSKTTKRQVNEFIEQGQSIMEIINYLFVCDYEATDILNILVKNFKCNATLVKDVFCCDYEIKL